MLLFFSVAAIVNDLVCRVHSCANIEFLFACSAPLNLFLDAVSI